MQLKNSMIIVGKICSGKSTLAKQIASRLRIPTASFGGYLSNYCKEHGIEIENRYTLQDLGNKFITENAPQFLTDVINYSTPLSENLVFEGVRHVVIFDLISKMSKSTFSIFIDVDQKERFRRIISRGKDTDRINNFEDFETFDNHVVEREIDDLKELCDLTVNEHYKVESILEKYPRSI